ncbi:MAG: hypothetical protein R3D66_04965 [Alphaproteobacteria bacterium]
MERNAQASDEGSSLITIAVRLRVISYESTVDFLNADIDLICVNRVNA